MAHHPFRLALALGGFLLAQGAAAEPLIWGIQVEQLEIRAGEGDEMVAWDSDALIGTDELRFVWRSEAKYLTDRESFETLENQLRLQTPVSDFFDAVAGIRFDTPEGPNRVHGVLGLHGLAPQWFVMSPSYSASNRKTGLFETKRSASISNHCGARPWTPKTP